MIKVNKYKTQIFSSTIPPSATLLSASPSLPSSSSCGQTLGGGGGTPL